MDGIIEQKNLMHSKINDAGKRNGLINTRNFMAESRDGLVSVYPTPQYQNCLLLGSAAAATLDSGRSEPVQQLLDPNTLQQSVESHYHPNIILYSEGMLRSWGDGVAADCCETTFIEDRSPTKESLEYPDGKFIDLSADDIKIHTLSYDVEEEEEFQDLEVRWEWDLMIWWESTSAWQKLGNGTSVIKCRETETFWVPLKLFSICERWEEWRETK